METDHNRFLNKNDHFGSWKRLSPAGMHETAFGQCAVRTGISWAAGYPMGLAFAFLFPHHDMAPPGVQDDTKLREKLIQSWKQSARTGMANGKTFARIGLIWAGSECAVETFRGQSGIENGVMAGCFTGAVLATGAGPSAMAMGCAGFASMAYVFDKMMHSVQNQH